MSKIGKSLIAIAEILGVITLAAGQLPGPYNYVVLAVVILVGLGVIAEKFNWV
jgi:hypothetical protein